MYFTLSCKFKFAVVFKGTEDPVCNFHCFKFWYLLLFNVFVLIFGIIRFRIRYYSSNLSIRIHIRTKVALRIIFVLVFDQISEPEYYSYSYSAIIVNTNSIRIRPNFWNRIVFEFVFGHENTIRSPLWPSPIFYQKFSFPLRESKLSRSFHIISTWRHKNWQCTQFLSRNYVETPL